ncbi:hypothetical protein E4U58_007173 [Claviceps cyperi]|nr:hypothetical protein E4U58_007173 [Claviceps cyperi]
MVRRDDRRPPKRNIEQVGQQDGQRLSTVPTEAARAAGTEETPVIDSASLPSRASVPSRRCSGCRTEEARRVSRRPPRWPQIGQENVAGQDNIAPRPVRRARRSRAQINADRAAEERKRSANVEEAMAAAEANARRIREQAESASVAEGARRDTTAVASAAEAEVEAARRDATLRESMAAAARASQETSRAAVLHESLERRQSLPHSYSARRGVFTLILRTAC